MRKSDAPVKPSNEPRPLADVSGPVLELPEPEDFPIPSTRLTPEQAFRFCEEMLPYFHHSALDQQMRADRSPEEFILK